jgi:hypothetical protein
VAVWPRITLRVSSALEEISLTAAASRVLADAGISCNVIVGAAHDHLLVDWLGDIPFALIRQLWTHSERDTAGARGCQICAARTAWHPARGPPVGYIRERFAEAGARCSGPDHARCSPPTGRYYGVAS